MSRLDLNPTIVNLVAELERRYSEIKQAQIIGSDSVKTFMVTNDTGGPAWGYNVYVANNVLFEMYVTFTPDDTSGKSTAGAYKLDWLANQSSVYVERVPVTDFTQQKWRVVTIGMAATFSLNVWVFSTGKGTLSFT